MPSDIAQQIVKQIFGDEKAAAIDSVNDALSASAFDAIQAKKLEFAKSMGFDLGDTGQDAADEVADKLATDDSGPEEVEVQGRKPEDPPAEEEQPEVTTDETDS